MAFELFGFEIKSKKDKKGKTFVTPENLRWCNNYS